MNRERLKNTVFSLLNVLVIAGVIVFIIAGLWKIGIVEMPDFLKNIVASTNSQSAESNKSTGDFLEDNKISDSYETVQLNPDTESVKKILRALVPAEKYSHDFQYKIISGKKSLTKRIAVIEQNGISCAYFVSGDGTSVNKQVIEANGKTIVNTISGQSLRAEEFASGDISFEEQIGAIITHKDFLALADNPDYSFSLASGEDGMLLIVHFSSVMGEYAQQQTYVLNLDYGIVTEAQCYENNRLIYTLTTNSISDNTDISLNIPRQFTEYIDALASDIRTEEELPEVQE